jgi:hypothetical protein
MNIEGLLQNLFIYLAHILVSMQLKSGARSSDFSVSKGVRQGEGGRVSGNDYARGLRYKTYSNRQTSVTLYTNYLTLCVRLMAVL